MRIHVSGEDLAQLEADLAVCFAYQKDKAPRGVRDVRLRRELAAQMKAEEFKGRTGDKLVWNADSRYPSRRFLVLGLGPQGGAPGESIRAGCARGPVNRSLSLVHLRRWPLGVLRLQRFAPYPGAAGNEQNDRVDRKRCTIWSAHRKFPFNVIVFRK